MRLSEVFPSGMLPPLALRFFQLSKSWDQGLSPSLETAQFSMLQCRGIMAPILMQVCDGGYGGNVMKK